MSFANRLRAIRIDRGFKQKDVAAAIGISEPNYSMYEHGTREPGITKLTKLASVLNVSADYLLGIAPNDVQSSQYVAILSRFTEDELKLFSILFGESFFIPRPLLLQIMLLYVNQEKEVRVQAVEQLLEINQTRDSFTPSLLPQPNLEQLRSALAFYHSYQHTLSDSLIQE